MDKSKINFHILFLLFFLFSLFSCNSSMIVRSSDSYIKNKIVQTDNFRSKEEILNAISAHIIKDTISFNDIQEGYNIFIVEACYTYGIASSTIYVFMGSTISNSNREVWYFVCMREILTEKVQVGFDMQQNEIVFKTSKGKTVMILPFESFSDSLDQ